MGRGARRTVSKTTLKGAHKLTEMLISDPKRCDHTLKKLENRSKNVKFDPKSRLKVRFQSKTLKGAEGSYF